MSTVWNGVDRFRAAAKANQPIDQVIAVAQAGGAFDPGVARAAAIVDSGNEARKAVVRRDWQAAGLRAGEAAGGSSTG